MKKIVLGSIAGIGLMASAGCVSTLHDQHTSHATVVGVSAERYHSYPYRYFRPNHYYYGAPVYYSHPRHFYHFYYRQGW